jgi:hypothetical protein
MSPHTNLLNVLNVQTESRAARHEAGRPIGVDFLQGRLAQLVERLLYTQDVGGSSPSPPTIPSYRVGQGRSGHEYHR